VAVFENRQPEPLLTEVTKADVIFTAWLHSSAGTEAE